MTGPAAGPPAQGSGPPSPRAAGVLFARALTQVDRVEPPELRDPIAAMLMAGIEQCTVERSLLGRPVGNLIALAHALAGDDQT